MPFEVPESWCWGNLLNVCHIFGRIGFRGYTKEDLVAYDGAITLSPSNIIDGKMNYNTCTYISWNKYDESPEIQIQDNDILLVKTGSSYGKCALVEKLPKQATINPQFVVLKHISCNPEYLTYVLQSKYAQYNYEKFVLGTAIPTFTQVALGNMQIPIPPLSEQNRIVTEIKRLLAIIESLENNQRHLKEVLALSKSKILEIALSGKLIPQNSNDEPAIELLTKINPAYKSCDNRHYENLPATWEEIELGNICQLFDGERIINKEYVNLDVKYLRGSKDGIKLTTGKYVPKDALMILVDGENSGEVFTTPHKGYQGSTFKQLKISSELNRDYVLLLIQHSRKLLKDNKVGSAIPHLNKKIFKQIHVPIPPYNEQGRIVKAVQNAINKLDNILAEL